MPLDRKNRENVRNYTHFLFNDAEPAPSLDLSFFFPSVWCLVIIQWRALDGRAGETHQSGDFNRISLSAGNFNGWDRRCKQSCEPAARGSQRRHCPSISAGNAFSFFFFSSGCCCLECCRRDFEIEGNEWMDETGDRERKIHPPQWERDKLADGIKWAGPHTIYDKGKFSWGGQQNALNAGELVDGRMHQTSTQLPRRISFFCKPSSL